MTDIKFATYSYTSIYNIKDEKILEIVMIKDYKHLMELQHTHMEQMLLKYAKVNC